MTSDPEPHRKVTLDQFDPERRAAVEKVLAKWRTPEHRAILDQIEEQVMAEFPPARDTRFDRIRALGGEAYRAYLEAGYREHHSRGADATMSTPYLLQKRVRDGGGQTLFFVNVYSYDHAQYIPDHPFGMVAEVQYNSHVGQDTFNVKLLDLKSPAETEAFFRAIYDRMGCEPYGDD